MKYLSSLKNKNLFNKICLLRVDFNIEANKRIFYVNPRGGLAQKIPLRIRAVLPTIKFLIKRGAVVVILSHRGKPKNKIKNKELKIKEFSLRPFAKILSRLLNKLVYFIDFDYRASDISSGSAAGDGQKFPDLILGTSQVKTSDILKIKNAPEGSIFLLENLRFLPGEERNDKKLAKQLASLGNFYVNDAFSVSHRKDASVAAMAEFLPSYAGLAFENELKNLNKVIKNFKKPLIIILGGAKISDKIGVIKNFLKKADYFLIGGGVANTFIAAQGLPIGDSLYEKQTIPLAQQILKSKKIILPIDLVIDQRKILDIGPQTAKKYAEIIKNAKTIIWNGPMGYFENPKFAKGSKAISKAIYKSHAFALIGGGETTSFIKNLKPKNSKLFISTGGGAMLEYLAGKKLPGIKALK